MEDKTQLVGPSCAPLQKLRVSNAKINLGTGEVGEVDEGSRGGWARQRRNFLGNAAALRERGYKRPRRVDASRACAGSRLNLRRVVHGQITDLELSFIVIEDWTRPVLVLDAHEDLVNAGCIKSSTGWQGDTQLDLVVRVVEAA